MEIIITTGRNSHETVGSSVGGGGAGLTAAITAAQNGAKVILVEKAGMSSSTMPSTNSPNIVGDGIRMAQEVNADLVGMGFAQLMPMSDPIDGSLFTGVWGSAETQFFVNKEGKRYVNEYAERDVLSKAALEQTDGIFYIICDPDFGKEFFGTPCDNGPFVATPRSPSLHHTMGGVKIDTGAHVIGTNGEAIPGLFAAGEVTGGIHAGNRLGGNAMTDFLVFGRIAGANASAE